MYACLKNNLSSIRISYQGKSAKIAMFDDFKNWTIIYKTSHDWAGQSKLATSQEPQGEKKGAGNWRIWQIKTLLMSQE